MYKNFNEPKPKKPKKYILSVLIVLMLGGCASEREPSYSPPTPPPSDLPPSDFMFITATSQDSLASLAFKYLNDERKAWQIAEFNGINQVTPGQKVIIPLKPFRPSGLTAVGYQTVPVLSYHHFSKTKRDKLHVRADHFEQQMQFLKDNGYRVITIDQLFEFLELGQVPEKSVVITIDDGWSDAYHIAFPILEKYGFPATLFIQTDLINQSQKTLSWTKIREMVNNSKIDVQCHTKTHRNLTKQNSGESFTRYFDAIERDLDESRQIIKQQLGFDVKYLAYPYGETNQLVVDLLKKKGYRGAFTVKRESNPFFVNNYRINRAMIYGHYGASHLKEFEKNLTAFEDGKITAVEPEPIDKVNYFRLISPQLAEWYDKKGHWRTALLHWKMIRDSLLVKGGKGERKSTAIKKIATLKRKLRSLANVHFNQGKYFYDKKDKDKAKAALLSALLFNPEHKQAHRFLKSQLAGEKHKLVKVKPNDTLKKIAQRVYGDSI
jgi:peptidoglycan/xylan/chitin deacetylase (PgdA/CDA1 family)